MIKFLFDNCQNWPIIGTPIKVAYIGHLVNNVIKDGARSSSGRDLKNLTGDELESSLQDEGNEIFDEHIMPHLKDSNIPQEILDAAKEKAVKKIVAKLRADVDAKVDKKMGYDKMAEEEAAAKEAEEEAARIAEEEATKKAEEGKNDGGGWTS